MMYTRHNKHITSLTLTSDVERTALGQPDEWQQEHGELYFQLNIPARPHMDLSPGEHVPGAATTQPHGNESHKLREITTGLHLPSFLSGEESQHLLPWKPVFRDHRGQWGRSRGEALCEQSKQHQARQQSVGLVSPPRYLIEGNWYEEQNLEPIENESEISKGEEPGR